MIIKKRYLNFGEGPTQGLDDTILTVEVKYPINFTQPRNEFVLSLHYNESNNFLFVNVKDYALCLGNISRQGLIMVRFDN